MEKVQILQALLTPLIAIITTYIAYQQWNANKLKLKLDRYDRRLRVYQEVVRILQLIVRDFNPKLEDLQNFRVAAAEADFVFGPEIRQYIQDIFSRGLRLNAARFDPDHNNAAEEISSEKRWFTEQLSIVQGQLVVAEKFRHDLDISK